MSEIVISDRQVAVKGDRCRISFAVTGTGVDKLWFETSTEYVGWITNSYDAAVVSLLLPAMVNGKNMRVKGPVSTRLAWFLGRTTMPIMSNVQKGASPIALTEFTPVGAVEPAANAVAMGLSTGVDSTTAVHEYGPGSNAPEGLRITHLIFNEIGAAGRFGEQGATELSDLRLENVRRAAQALGLPLIETRSNADAHQKGLVHIENHVLKNAAVPLLLQRGIRTFLYAADVAWPEMTVKIDNPSFTDPMLIPDLSTENVEMRSVGAEHNRIDKAKMISQLPFAHHHLDVCSRSYPNCSTCRKCMSTMMVLESIGTLDLFADRFDIPRFKRFQTRWAVWTRFHPTVPPSLSARLYSPRGLKNTTAYYALVTLNRVDAAMRFLPGYRRFVGKGLPGRVRRRLLYRI